MRGENSGKKSAPANNLATISLVPSLFSLNMGNWNLGGEEERHPEKKKRLNFEILKPRTEGCNASEIR